MCVVTEVCVCDSCEQVIDASAIVLGQDAPFSPEQVAHRQFMREQVGLDKVGMVWCLSRSRRTSIRACLLS